MTLDLFSAPAPSRPPLWEWTQSLSPEDRVWFDAMTERCTLEFVTDRQAEVDRISRARACGLEIVDQVAAYPRRGHVRIWIRPGHTSELAAILGRGRPFEGFQIEDYDGRACVRIAREPKTVSELGAYEKKAASTTGPRRLMTEEEITTILRLSACSFSPGSWDKKFARDMTHEASQLNPLITEKQAAQLPRLAHRYRKQLATKSAEVSRG